MFLNDSEIGSPQSSLKNKPRSYQFFRIILVCDSIFDKSQLLCGCLGFTGEDVGEQSNILGGLYRPA